MTKPPESPMIYHITHVDNLVEIVGSGRLLSDASMLARGGGQTIIGMSDIKKRRLVLPVPCQDGTRVGDCVPFYFCSRSIMLYVIHRANHEALSYRGGQEPIIHLEADLHDVVAWANENGGRWAFSLSNAGAYYAEFCCELDRLSEINWKSVGARQWSAPETREAKQAEFLMHGEFPWSLISRIGVIGAEMKARVETALEAADHKPAVAIQRTWYY